MKREGKKEVKKQFDGEHSEGKGEEETERWGCTRCCC